MWWYVAMVAVPVAAGLLLAVFAPGTPPHRQDEEHPMDLEDIHHGLSARRPPRLEPADNRDGTCADCGQPVWWAAAGEGGHRLVTRDGNKWCYGPGRTRISMERQHHLEGTPQWVAPAPQGQVCHCLAAEGAHIHQIVPAPEVPDAG